MADNVTIDNGTETDFDVASEQLSDGSHLQSVELYTESVGTKTKFGTDSNPIKVDPSGDTEQPVSHAALTELAAAIDTEVQVDIVGSIPAGDNNVGNVDIVTVPADPFGANADAAVAAGATGSIQAKLRRISTDIDAIKTAVETLDNVVAGTEAQVDVVESPAALRTSDSISAALAVDRLMNNLTAVTPVMVAVDVASSGDNTLVAAQGSGNIILVHQVFLIASAAVTVRFESGAGGTALTGQMQLAANSGFVLPFNPVGWFKTSANALLNLELSGAVSVDGVLGYTVVT